MKIIEDAKRLAMETGNFIGQKAKQVGDWCVQHPGEASMIACGILGLAGKMISNRMSITKQERNRIDHTYYDPSTGMHWDLRRKATNADRKILSEARANGDDIYETLRSRGLIR